MGRRAGTRAMRPLVGVNAALIGIALTAVAYIASQLLATPEPRAAAIPRMAATVPATSATERTEASPPGAYAVVASRNLFSPSRSDVPSNVAGTPVTSSLPKPHLYGVVVREGKSIAYLEDPATKRVTGYRPGDTIAGATIREITADRVVLARADGPVEVRLNDPTKPRPPAPVASIASPGASSLPGGGAAVAAAETPSATRPEAPLRAPQRRMPFRFNARPQ